MFGYSMRRALITFVPASVKHNLKLSTKITSASHVSLSDYCGRRYINSSSCVNRISGLPFGNYNFPESQKEVEVSTDEWHYVERLILPKKIPEPAVPPGTDTPSGWVAPSASKDDNKYFVQRNANKLLRVYFNHHPIMQRTLTHIKGIDGDIFALAEELNSYLLERSKKRIITMRVHEPHCTIIIRGDFVNAVKRFLIEKGF